MLIGAICFVVVFLIVSLIVLLMPIIKRRQDDKQFFKRVYEYVYQVAKDKDFYLINNVEIAIDTKTIHFNHILFGNKYIYCISNLPLKGGLSGKFQDEQWFKYDENNTRTVGKNPMLLHKARLDYLISALNVKEEDLFIGICVCNDSCLIDDIEGMPKNLAIINESDIYGYICEREKENIASIDQLQLDGLVHSIYQKNNANKMKK